ncbi:IS110 family transposase [Huintestinicola butyrica]|uniref:IS110 family transposase n=1 Tax=Huintestinicola butyrica TaxID=2981728 RepID=UPI003F7D5D99
MNAVGIDVSKGKSTVAVLRPFGEVAASPFDVIHNDNDLKQLAELIKALPGESKVVMEYTGTYFEPIAQFLHNNGIFVSVVNALLVHDYGGNSLRKVKTDKKDALKLASYALDRWTELDEYIPADEQRKTLKLLNRQYNQSIKIQTMMKNNLISLTDSVFPGINKLFTSPERQSDCREKWVDFLKAFPHRDCVAKLYLSVFKTKYKSWCSRNKYKYSEAKAEEIHAYAKSVIAVLPLNDNVKLLVTQAVSQLNTILETLSSIRDEMNRIASSLPEYDTVMSMFGVGKVYGPQLIAEVGDTRRFINRRAITAFAGLDAPPYQSGQLDVSSRHISKRGSAALRKVLFQITEVYILNKPEDEPVYQFIDKKRSEGKHYYSYRIAAANKFLRIYFAKVNQLLTSQ